MSESSEYGTVKTGFGKRGFLELLNCPKQESDPSNCILCDKFVNYVNSGASSDFPSELFKGGIRCSMTSNMKCGNSLCFNFDNASTNNCNRFGKVIECRIFQHINQSGKIGEK